MWIVGDVFFFPFGGMDNCTEARGSPFSCSDAILKGSQMEGEDVLGVAVIDAGDGGDS